MMNVAQTLSLEARRRDLRDSCSMLRKFPVLASGDVVDAIRKGSTADKTGEVAQQE